MGTLVGTGASIQRATPAAAAEATAAARSDLRGETPSYGFVFASPEHELRAALSVAKEAAGGAVLVGSSTAGELTAKGLLHGSVVVMLVASDNSACHAAFAPA